VSPCEGRYRRAKAAAADAVASGRPLSWCAQRGGVAAVASTASPPLSSSDSGAPERPDEPGSSPRPEFTPSRPRLDTRKCSGGPGGVDRKFFEPMRKWSEDYGLNYTWCAAARAPFQPAPCEGQTTRGPLRFIVSPRPSPCNLTFIDFA